MTNIPLHFKFLEEVKLSYNKDIPSGHISITAYKTDRAIKQHYYKQISKVINKLDNDFQEL